MLLCHSVMSTRTNDQLLDEVYPGTKRKRPLKPMESLISIEKAQRMLGYKPEFGPNAHGFDYFYGFLAADRIERATGVTFLLLIALLLRARETVTASALMKCALRLSGVVAPAASSFSSILRMASAK